MSPVAILADVPAFRRLLGYVLRYRADFVLGLACVIVTTSVALAGADGAAATPSTI